jgi:signal transduction histidine kinase
MKFSFLKVGARLRNKIFLGVALVAIIPFVASGLFAFYVINRAHGNDVLKIETNLLNEKAVEIQKYISDSLGQLEINITLPLATKGIVRYLQPTEQFGNQKLVKTLSDGKRIVFGIDPPSQLDDLLHNAIVANKAFNELYFIDVETGLEVAYASNYSGNYISKNPFTDFSGLAQFKNVKQSGSDYAGDVNLTLDGPVMEIAAPVKDQDGHTVAVLSGELNLAGLDKIFSGTALGNSGYVYLLDSGGKFLYGSEQGRLFNIAESFSPADFGRISSAPQLSQLRYKSFWGGDVVATARAISVSGDSASWTLVAEWPTQDADQAINTLGNQFIFFLLIVFLLTVILSIFLANRIAKPIGILQTGTERIAGGVFDAPVEIKTNDELEDLGAAFNKMMAGLKQLQELKDEFVFIAAHELRTPVAAIKGYLSMVMDGSVGVIDKDAKDFIGKVVEANQRLIQLVNDLLQVARSDAGRLTIKVASIDIAESINSTFDELKPLAVEKSITLAYEPAGDGRAMADAMRLKEVLVNLVGNAIKYSGNGGKVTISHEKKDKNLIMHVADTGFGISKEAQAKLFEKFYRVQTDKTREIMGTGLGLFIVKQIVEKMGGKIWVESEEGKGSVFSFNLLLE